MKDRTADRISGALGMALAIAYVLHAHSIEDSMLADAVGAAGVPTGVGVMLALASLALLLKTFRSVSDDLTEEMDEPEMEAASVAPSPHAMAAGLLLILAVYVALLPVLGYVLSIGLLIGAVAWFAGARQLFSVIACMVVAGPLLWLLFDWALEIRLPVGLWPQWLGK
jgi:putative tricarboxylic transport membrane protein